MDSRYIEHFRRLFMPSVFATSGMDIKRLIDQQPEKWAELLAAVSDGLNNEGDVQAARTVDRLKTAVAADRSFKIEPSTNPTGVKGSGDLPLIFYSNDEERYEFEEIARTQPRSVLAALVETMPETVSTFVSMHIGPEGLSRLFLNPETIDLRQRYSAGVAAERKLEAVKLEMEQRVEVAEKAARAAARRFEETLRQAEDLRSSLVAFDTASRERFDSQAKMFQDSYAEYRNKLIAEWADFMRTAGGQIEAARALAHESKTLIGAKTVWSQKKVIHGRVFGIGLFGLALIVGLGIGLLIYFWTAIIAAIPKNTSGEIVASALILFVIPMVAIAWVVRIFARWVTNAMTLGEDAAQRRAMLETYFQLVGDKNANMQDSDRILILNAIFRPLPGHQSDDVAPPTLLDLTKSAIAGKGGG